MLTGLIKRDILLRRISAIPRKRRLSIKGDLKTDQADLIAESIFSLNESSSRPIFCTINSEGGEIEAGLSLVDIFRFSNAPVIGLVVRRAHSAALLALQGCRERYALCNARLGIHNSSLRWMVTTEWRSDLEVALSKMLTERIGEIDGNREAALQIFLESTKLQREGLEEIMNASVLMRAREALELGFLDAVGS